MPERVAFMIDGAAVEGEAGTSVLAALWNAGRLAFRRSVSGESRGPLCAMGICYECRVSLDGRRDRRSCQEAITPRLVVQTDEVSVVETGTDDETGRGSLREGLTADVAVVGLGPAGLAACVSAAEAGAQVVALDDGLEPGGQIWRHRPGERGNLPRKARAWLERFDRLGAKCRVLEGAMVVDALPPGRLTALQGERRLEVEGRALVVATGARERFLPFPGWTLGGVIGVGAAQALLKTGALFRGLRVVVAGSGPLLLPVAASLARAGARVVAVAEQASRGRVFGFAAGLVTQPEKLAEAALYRAAFAGTRYRRGTWVEAARGSERLEAVSLTDGRRSWDVACDVLACGYGLVPNLELPRLLGCQVEGGRVKVDDSQLTSVAGVFAAGETCGIGGADLALLQGEAAGLAAAGRRPDAVGLARRSARLRAFSARLERAFALRPELRRLAGPETTVCRCEDVPLKRLRPEWSPRQAKLYTRAGMGPCQGRVCGAALEFLFGWPADTVRPPLFPVPVGSMKEA
jgi:NADPH-dependent 2,4-dienoyl-CoA reductase/sulfur reductase-like enzyme